MCKFRSIIGDKSNSCLYSELDALNNSMPIDEEGYCILHSKNVLWKKENGFNDYVKNIIIYLMN